MPRATWTTNAIVPEARVSRLSRPCCCRFKRKSMGRWAKRSGRDRASARPILPGRRLIPCLPHHESLKGDTDRVALLRPYLDLVQRQAYEFAVYVVAEPIDASDSVVTVDDGLIDI